MSRIPNKHYVAQGVRGASTSRKERENDATPGTSGPPAVATVAKDYQVTHS